MGLISLLNSIIIKHPHITSNMFIILTFLPRLSLNYGLGKHGFCCLAGWGEMEIYQCSRKWNFNTNWKTWQTLRGFNSLIPISCLKQIRLVRWLTALLNARESWKEAHRNSSQKGQAYGLGDGQRAANSSLRLYPTSGNSRMYDVGQKDVGLNYCLFLTI